MTRVARLLVTGLLFAVTLLLWTHSYSTTFYSTQNGPWADPETWGGTLPDLKTDSIVIAHVITMTENITLEELARLTILASGRLEETGNRTLNLETGTVLYNAGEIAISKIKNAGTIYNTGLIDLEGDFINHEGTIYNDQMIYTKNLLTQGGMLSGDGGQYMIWNNLNSTAETIATCTGAHINICNPDGVTDPCNGQGFFDPECVMICGQVLSLDLIAFEATPDRNGDAVEITWTTTHEVGLFYFVVERFWMEHWAIISPPIQAEGNMEDGMYHYSFVDERPNQGTNTYRLACHGVDGNYSYSSLASAEILHSSCIRLAPNPFASSVDIYGDLSGYDHLEIIDGVGRVVRVFRIDGSQLQLSDLETGWYTARLTGVNGELNFMISKF